MTSVGVRAVPVPVSGAERVEVLDVIRGVAVFGILIMNIVPLSGTLMFNLGGGSALPGARFDAAVAFLIDFLAHAKFYSLFSFLFGLGFAIFLERAEARGAAGVRLFRRRLTGLFLIGLIHTTLIWFGDILNVYALLGFLLVPFRRASNRTLAVTGLALCASPIAIYGLALLVRAAAGGGVGAPPGDPAAMPPFLAEAIRAFGSGTYFDVLKGNVMFTLAGWIRRIVTLFLVRMFGMFLLGVWAHRAGIFRDPGRHRDLLRRVCLWSFVLGAPASALGAWMGDPGVQFVPDLRGLIWTVLLSVGSTGLCLFYASGLTLLFERPRWRARLLVLAPVGASALSNYLLQSVLAIAIFYGLGFGLYSRVSLIVALLIACGMYAAQVLASHVWMARAAYGPAEWVWRQFTYRRRFPLWKDRREERASVRRGSGGGTRAMTSRVLLLSTTTGYQLRSYDQAAARRGVEIVLATDRCHHLDDPWRDRAIAVRFYDPSSSLEAIDRAAEAGPFSAVLSVGDRPTVLAARAAVRLGLPGNPVDAAAASVDKRAARTRFAAAGLIVPGHVVIPADRELDDAARDERIPFPCVLKPTGLSGSRGVIRADNASEFLAAASRIRRLLSRPEIRAERTGSDDILVEEFVPGREYAVEGVLTRGALHVFTIFDKPDPLDGPFFEETIYVTPSALGDGECAAVRQTVERGAHALGLRHGPIHAELRLRPAGADDAAGIVLLEIASRPIGGLCSGALRFEGGASLEDVLLDHALGGDATRRRRERAASAVMMIPIPKRGLLKRVEGEERARARPHVTDVRITAKPDQLLEPLPEAGSYLGFIFASAPSPALAECAVRDAHRELRFTIERPLEMVNGIWEMGNGT